MSDTTVASFDFGRAFGQVFSLVWRNLGSFVLLSLILGVATLLVALAVVVPAAGLSAVQKSQPGNWATGITVVLIIVVSLASLALSHVVFVYRALASLGDRPKGVGACLRAGFANLLPVLGVMLIAGLGSFIGGMFFIVPGVFISVVYSAAVPAQVAEGKGVIASLARSWELTRGNRWAVFALHLVAGLVLIIGFYILFGITFAVQALIMAGFGSADQISTPQMMAMSLIQLPISLLLYTVLFAGIAAIPSSIYAELVRIRGGGPEVASVFA